MLMRRCDSVLLQYQGTLANIPKVLKAIDDRSSTLVTSYQPDNDLKALIERYRTGPFHPTPQVYESVAHDESDIVFGIDLRKWAEGGWVALTTGEQKKELYPNVLSALLDGLQEAYGRLPNDLGQDNLFCSPQYIWLTNDSVNNREEEVLDLRRAPCLRSSPP
jgi:hypothetical protein